MLQLMMMIGVLLKRWRLVYLRKITCWHPKERWKRWRLKERGEGCFGGIGGIQQDQSK